MKKDSKHRVKKKQTERSRRNRLLLGFFLGFVLIAGILFGYYSLTFTQFFTSIQDPDSAIDSEENSSVLTNHGPISILFLGIDERPDDPGRADTIIVATLNPHTKDTHLISIPRDTLITLPQTDAQLDKVNATYTYGGMSEVIEAVEVLLDIPIHFYAKLNFDGFIDLVDVVGGVDVVADFPFTVSGSTGSQKEISIQKGPQHLNGEDALGYARMRKQDPRGDFGRQDRQREVIQSLMEQLLSFESLTKFNTILKTIQPNLSTNVNANQAFSIVKEYQPATGTIYESTIPGNADSLYIPVYEQEVYVWIPDEPSLEDLQQTLQKHLNLKRPDYAPVQAKPVHS